MCDSTSTIAVYQDLEFKLYIVLFNVMENKLVMVITHTHIGAANRHFFTILTFSLSLDVNETKMLPWKMSKYFTQPVFTNFRPLIILLDRQVILLLSRNNVEMKLLKIQNIICQKNETAKIIYGTANTKTS